MLLWCKNTNGKVAVKCFNHRIVEYLNGNNERIQEIHFSSSTQDRDRRRRPWTDDDNQVLSDYILNSNDLTLFRYGDTFDCSMDYQHAQDCVVAASQNPNVSHIELCFHLGNNDDDLQEKINLIQRGKGKVKSLHLSTGIGGLNADLVSSLNAQITSLDELEELELLSSRDDYLLDLMERFAQRRPSTLKRLKLRDPSLAVDQSGTLLGLDMFLASEGSSSLELLDVSLHYCTESTMTRITNGLSRNTSITKLELHIHNTTLQGANVLSKYLNDQPEKDTLKSLHLSYLQQVRRHGVELAPNEDMITPLQFQELILPALYVNKALKELEVGVGLFDTNGASSVSQLIERNKHLHKLTCSDSSVGCGRTFDGAMPCATVWLESLVAGLQVNQVLEQFSVHVQDHRHRRFDFGTPAGLETVNSAAGLQIVKAITAVKDEPSKIQRVVLDFPIKDEEVIEILETLGKPSVRTLDSLDVKLQYPLVVDDLEEADDDDEDEEEDQEEDREESDGNEEVPDYDEQEEQDEQVDNEEEDNQTLQNNPWIGQHKWTRIADLLPNLRLRRLSIRRHGSLTPRRLLRDKLLHGIHLNLRLEHCNITFNDEDDSGCPKFKYQIQHIIYSNKLSNTHWIVPGAHKVDEDTYKYGAKEDKEKRLQLPLAYLPIVQKVLWKRCRRSSNGRRAATKLYKKLWRQVLFDLLKSSYDPYVCDHFKDFLVRSSQGQLKEG